MNAVPFRPRACGDDAWRRWLRDAFSLMKRGWGSWLAFSMLATCFSALAVAYSGWAALAAIVVLGPWFGVELALAEALAAGTTGAAGLFQAAWQDVRSHAKGYAKALLIRSVLAGGFVAAYRAHHAGEPVGDPIGASMHPLLFGGVVWFFLWFVAQVVRWDGCVGFYPWLRVKSSLPFLTVVRLDHHAYRSNLHSLRVLQLIMVALFALGASIPLFAACAAPFWACLLRCAYADIFRQGGLNTVKPQAEYGHATMKHDSDDRHPAPSASGRMGARSLDHAGVP